MIPYADLPDTQFYTCETRRLWSLWEMQYLFTGSFTSTLETLIKSIDRLSRLAPGPLIPTMMGNQTKVVQLLKTYCDEIHLPITKRLLRDIERASTITDLLSAYKHVKRTMQIELENRVFLEPDARYKEYFRKSTLFGDKVFVAFSSANNDIFEAGTCLALERPTACVMHLMRVMEAGLKALALALGIIEPQNDWGAYLRKIEKELENRYKISGARSDDEQFYSEAALGFDRVRRAWRNPTMHIENSYSTEQAEEILRAVKSSISFLATRISE